MFKMDSLNESEGLKKLLEPWLKKLIQEQTKNCVRRRTFTVVTAPNGKTMGVQEPYDTTIMDLPYRAEAAGAQVGDTVTVEWCYGLSNAVVVGRGGTGIQTASDEEISEMLNEVFSEKG